MASSILTSFEDVAQKLQKVVTALNTKGVITYRDAGGAETPGAKLAITPNIANVKAGEFWAQVKS